MNVTAVVERMTWKMEKLRQKANTPELNIMMSADQGDGVCFKPTHNPVAFQ